MRLRSRCGARARDALASPRALRRDRAFEIGRAGSKLSTGSILLGDRLRTAASPRPRACRRARTATSTESSLPYEPAMPSTIDVQRPTPTFSRASSRSNTRTPSRTTKSAPSRCSTPFRKTWNGRWTSRGEADAGCAARRVFHAHRMPAPCGSSRSPSSSSVRSSRCSPSPRRRSQATAASRPSRRSRRTPRGSRESYWFISTFCLAIFLLVEGLLVAFVIRYRRRSRARDADGAQIHGSTGSSSPGRSCPVVILFVDRGLRLREAPRIQDVPAATGGQREPRRRRDRHAVHVGVPLPERRRSRSTGSAPRRDGRSSCTSPRPTGT